VLYRFSCLLSSLYFTLKTGPDVEELVTFMNYNCKDSALADSIHSIHLDLFVFICVYFACFCFILHSCCIIVSMVGWT